MNRRSFVSNSLALGISSFVSLPALEALVKEGKAPYPIDDKDLIPCPTDPAEWPVWREALNSWRKQKRQELDYNGSSYGAKPFEWVASSFACCFVMMYDEAFYDSGKKRYRVNDFINEGKKQYGGYDSVVLWHAYPRIGLDQRNQFDFYRDMPGGLPGIRKVVKTFHQKGIKVFINYNPWDTGTRRETSPDIDGLITIVKAIDADGIFLDTMKDAPDFRQKLDQVKPGLVMEGEIALPLEHVESHHMSWAQGFKDSEAPGVYRNKWFERRHMQHAIHRWGNDKSDKIHTAWMNGSGKMIWENVFGQWIGWNKRDLTVYRSVSAIQHHFSELFSGEDWTPLSQQSPMTDIFISMWEQPGIKLWTLINRGESEKKGLLMQTEHLKDHRYFDLVEGLELKKDPAESSLKWMGDICQRGVGCFLAIRTSLINRRFKKFLNKQKEALRNASYDTTIPIKNNVLVPLQRTNNYTQLPAGMLAIPATKKEFLLEYTLNEIGSYGTIQDHLVISARNRQFQTCHFSRELSLSDFAIDETPVTNAMYLKFINEAGYKPAVKDNYLKHWINGRIPEGLEHHPVVYVDLGDARAYARWAGKRLPTEFEWQHAAQGPLATAYPWGNEMEAERCNPHLDGTTTPVKAYPKGKSGFGCYDMCGNTWELTESEHTDTRTRFLMLKGGSCFKAKGSHWYADGGPQRNGFLAKMLLLWPGLDRCSTIGFRCAADMSTKNT